jgi:hypothetical protein
MSSSEAVSATTKPPGRNTLKNSANAAGVAMLIREVRHGEILPNDDLSLRVGISAEGVDSGVQRLTINVGERVVNPADASDEIVRQRLVSDWASMDSGCQNAFGAHESAG